MTLTDQPQIGPAYYLAPPAPVVHESGARHYVGVTYAQPLGYRPLLLDLWVPESASAAPLVVWIHGGGWLFGDRRYLPETLRPNSVFEALVAAGLAVATIDYRHSREAPFPAQLHDVKAAVRYLRGYADQLGVDVARIGVWGESAGGHLAALVGLTATRPDLEGTLGLVGPSSAVDAVVDWYGVSDLRSMPERRTPAEIAEMMHPELAVTVPEHVLLEGVDDATRTDANPVAHVHAGAPRFLLVHGDADVLVPFEQSETLAARLAEAGVPAELVRVPGAGHIFAGSADVDAVVGRSVDFLVEALAR